MKAIPKQDTQLTRLLEETGLSAYVNNIQWTGLSTLGIFASSAKGANAKRPEESRRLTHAL
jgi:hypothetical protein